MRARVAAARNAVVGRIAAERAGAVAAASVGINPIVTSEKEKEKKGDRL